MTCIKTGCTVYFISYGLLVRADLFQIDTAIIVKWNPNSGLYQPAINDADYAVASWRDDTVWYRDDLATAVMPASYLIKLT